MPEGPEVRREADAIARALRGRPIVRADYRVPGLHDRARVLEGARVTRAWSRGKAMLIAFENRHCRAVSISAAQLAYMLEGIDWRNPQLTWRPTRAG